MNTLSTRKIVLNALMIALVFLATKFTTIPLAVGYFNIGDVAILVTAIILGRNSGFLAGAIGSCLADLASGYFIYAPITFVVKGIEGYAAGVISSGKGTEKSAGIARIVAIVAGALIMVVGYFVAELYILKFFDPTFGLVTAVKNLLPNLVQGGISSVVAYVISTVLVKANLMKYVME